MKMKGLDFLLQYNDITQTELAQKLGINKVNITRWIKGQRKIPKGHLKRLSEEFNCEEDFFEKEIEFSEQVNYVRNKLGKTIEYTEEIQVIKDCEGNEYEVPKITYKDEEKVKLYNELGFDYDVNKAIEHARDILTSVENDAEGHYILGCYEILELLIENKDIVPVENIFIALNSMVVGYELETGIDGRPLAIQLTRIFRLFHNLKNKSIEQIQEEKNKSIYF